jgi:hypothetical protein
MSMLATSWEPSLNPVGAASLFALGAATLAWVLVDWPALARFKPAVIFASLLVFVAFLVLSAANIVALEPLHLSIKRRRFPDFDDYLANCILLAVGLLFSFKLIRRPISWVRDIGLVLTVVWCGAVLAEVFGTIYWYYGS